MHASIKCAGFDAEELHLLEFSGSEELGRMFSFHARVAATQALDLDDILGKSVTIKVPLDSNGDGAMPSDGERYFSGQVARAVYLGLAGANGVYELTVAPHLWSLTLRTDCRIFQKKSVPDILRAVLEQHGITGNRLDRSGLMGNYRTKEFVVQYRESDFNFISRLMEQEGIYYYFKHEKNDHKMVLVDSPAGHRPVAGLESIPFLAHGTVGQGDHISDWQVSSGAQPTKYVHTDFDFKKPRMSLEKSDETGTWKPKGEVFDYPGEFVYEDDGTSELEEGARYSRIRRQEIHATREVIQAATNSVCLHAGAKFRYVPDSRDPRKSLDGKEYLVVSAHYYLSGLDQASTGATSGSQAWGSMLRVIDSAVNFRTQRNTPKPIISGPQTALVVGKSGEEIDTDKYGRVKLRFHWDRKSPGNENSSCWVRVAQLWAGKNWGAMFVPRVGQEVVVEFLEGDPDQPLVTGRVYNAEHMPPYALPANRTQSGIKSRSSKQGGAADFNELRFEDKKGQEEVYLHAQKDRTTVVENDDVETIGNNQRVTVEKGNHALTVAAGKSEIEAQQSILLKVGQTSVLIDNSGVTIKGMMVKIEGSSMFDAKAPMTSIVGDATVTIKGGIVSIN